jgi:regulator of sirC expression with transglutaminase-like and TPR domain
LAVFIVSLASMPCAAVADTQPKNSRYLTYEERVALDLLRLPEEQIDIGEAALRLSALILPDADVPKGVAELNALAAEVARLVGTKTDPDFRIRAINTVLYRRHGFQYDFERMERGDMGVDSPLLWHYLQTKRGNCVSMPVLWYAVAERLGYPVFAVEASQHLFLRYEDGAGRINIETTSGGGELPDSDYVGMLQLPDEALRSGAMMRTLTKREFLAILVGQLGVTFSRLNNYGAAVTLLEGALQNNPMHVMGHWDLAVIYSSLGYTLTAKSEVLSKNHQDPNGAELPPEFELALRHAHTATELGATKLVEKDYWKKLIHPSGSEAVNKVRPRPYDVAADLHLDRSAIRVQLNYTDVRPRERGTDYVPSPTTCRPFCTDICATGAAPAYSPPAFPEPRRPGCTCPGDPPAQSGMAVESPYGPGSITVPR